jgi:hypothetical protein
MQGRCWRIWGVGLWTEGRAFAGRTQSRESQSEIDKEKTGQKIKDINKHVNQPTSKKAEWDRDGNPGKSDLTPDETHFMPHASARSNIH